MKAIYARQSLDKKDSLSIEGQISECKMFLGVNEEYKIYISHACDEELALSAKEMIEKQIANTEIEVILLTPVFTTQGGPGCVAIQAIKKHDILK